MRGRDASLDRAVVCPVISFPIKIHFALKGIFCLSLGEILNVFRCLIGSVLEGFDIGVFFENTHTNGWDRRKKWTG